MTEVELDLLLARMAGKRVLVVGDIILDEYLFCDPRRLSAEAPIPVVELRERAYRLGGAANVAATIVGLGGKVILGGVIGTDRHGEILAKSLAGIGVECGGVLSDTERPTTTKTRVLAQNQQLVRVDIERDAILESRLEARFLEWFEAVVPSVDACVISDYAKGVVTPGIAERLIRLARHTGKPVVVDPKGSDYTKYRNSTVVKPNLLEAEQVLHRPLRTEADLIELGRRTLDLLAGSALLVTRGSLGMALLRLGIEPLHIPTVAKNVFDVTGAGDTVVGALALALAAAASLEQAIRLANRAAGVVVGKVGTASLTPDELRGSPEATSARS